MLAGNACLELTPALNGPRASAHGPTSFSSLLLLSNPSHELLGVVISHKFPARLQKTHITLRPSLLNHIQRKGILTPNKAYIALDLSRNATWLACGCDPQ